MDLTTYESGTGAAPRPEIGNPGLLVFLAHVVEAERDGTPLRQVSRLDPAEFSLAIAASTEVGVIERTGPAAWRITPAGLDFATRALAPISHLLDALSDHLEGAQ